MSKHIPLPWAADHGCIWTTIESHRAEWMIADLSYADDSIIPFSEAEATAEFIVRACNSHEELLAVLKRAEFQLARLLTHENSRAALPCLDEIRRTIKKVEGT